LNTDVYKFESSQKDEIEPSWFDSSKAHRKPRAFVCHLLVITEFRKFLKVAMLLASLEMMVRLNFIPKHDCVGEYANVTCMPVAFRRAGNRLMQWW